MTQRVFKAAKALGLAAAFSLTALPGMAATISVETYSLGAYATATSGWAQTTVETFEDETVGEIGRPLATDVGSFTTLGGRGTGSSVTGTGYQLAVRNAPNYGRSNTTARGANFLDSNDTMGMLWNVGLAGGRMFDRIAFSISDVADQGARLEILANGTLLTTMLNQGPSVVDLVMIEFDSLVSSAEIRLSNSRTNDGFGIDDVTVGAVPLPAGGMLMLTAFGGLALLRRRQA